MRIIPPGTIMSTGIPSITTTTGLTPTTTTMNYCLEEKGMNQPLYIQPNQVTSNPPPEQTTPPGDINPTSTTPGLNYPSTNPQINITLDQPATLTLIYVPVARPDQPSSNVDEYTVQFVYPNGTSSRIFTSEIPSMHETTTTPSGLPPSETTTTTPSTSLPSKNSPQVDLPTNFRVPTGTIIVITITSTNDDSNPTGVCILFLLLKLLF